MPKVEEISDEEVVKVEPPQDDLEEALEREMDKCQSPRRAPPALPAETPLEPAAVTDAQMLGTERQRRKRRREKNKKR